MSKDNSTSYFSTITNYVYDYFYTNQNSTSKPKIDDENLCRIINEYQNLENICKVNTLALECNNHLLETLGIFIEKIEKFPEHNSSLLKHYNHFQDILLKKNQKLQKYQLVHEKISSKLHKSRNIDDSDSSPLERDNGLCIICESEPLQKLLECGHAFCAVCVARLRKPECPMCRQSINENNVRDLFL